MVGADRSTQLWWLLWSNVQSYQEFTMVIFDSRVVIKSIFSYYDASVVNDDLRTFIILSTGLVVTIGLSCSRS